MNNVFDGVRTALGNYDSYPPFNFEEIDSTHYRATFALAGFAKADLSVTVKENWLLIEVISLKLRKTQIRQEFSCIRVSQIAHLSEQFK